MKIMFYRFLQTAFVGTLLLLFSLDASAQDRRVTGKITSGDGPIPGTNVVLKGTSTGTSTDANGDFTLNVSGTNPVLVISAIGFGTQEVSVGNRTTVNLTLSDDANALEEVIVTGYTSEKKKDIVGSVSIVDTKSLQSQPTANLQNALQGRAAGVTVSGTGAPGAGAKVRIRGFVSFGNNDPLYVIDGVPTYDPANLNPQDIASIQVLKDPVSASIYGSRAANGVIVVTTKQGTNKKTEISYDGYVGVQTIQDSKFPKMLNTQQYGEYLWRSFAGAGIANPSHKVYGTGAQPTVPAFLIGNGIGGVGANDPRANPNLYSVQTNVNPDIAGNYQISQTSPGTNWFKEIYQPGTINNHQISAQGGSERGFYALGLNYFGQQGNYIKTKFEKYSIRANTQFKPREWFRLGENFQVTMRQYKGTGGDLDFAGEGSPWAQAYRMVPYVPVYDIKGNFGGNSAGESGNGTSPVANLNRSQNDRQTILNLFGNVYAQVDIIKNLTASTSFGFDGGMARGFNFTAITYERGENQKSNTFNEFAGEGLQWTWTNSLAYRRLFGTKHDVRLFAATEAIKNTGRFIAASRDNYDFADPSFVAINTGKSLPRASGAPNNPRSLYSVFGKAEYTYADKYLFSATLRRDGSSVFGPENRYAVFPAIGLGWRISEESFMKSVPWITDLKLRGGWGQMGSERNVGPTNSYSFYQADINNTAYDITGNNGVVVIGYAPDRVGNLFTKWETAEMVNIGLDGSLWNGKIDFALEYFNNQTKDLLVSRQRNGLEQTANQPQINVGTMVNKGFDASIGTKGDIIRGLSYDVGLTFTSYKNEATKLDAEGSAFFEQSAGRLQGVQRTQAGRPLSAFYGYLIDGIYQNVEEVASGPIQTGIDKKAPQSGVGLWRYRDLNNDGTINDQDRTFLGSPIPKFQTGLDLTFKYKNFDLNMFGFWNYGNDIYNYTKWWTDLRGFVGGVSERALTNSWTPQNPGATLPILNSNDTQSGTVSNNYYIESGSYFRLRTLQLGFSAPDAFAKKLGLSRVRLYVQGQNLFTITKYLGPDPDISILGDELNMGVDQFRTPAPTIFLGGLGVTF